MKLVIHAGLHKTATTTFQEICTNYSQKMIAEKVCYPRISERGGHNWLVWELARGNPEPMLQCLKACEACVGQDGVAILSAEDLESCLLDIGLAQTIEQLALEAGATQTEWVFVRRERLDYLTSVYAEMSKHGAAHRIMQFAAASAKYGYACCASPDFNFMFFVEPEKFITRFREAVRGSVDIVDFRDFLAHFPGHLILATCLPAEFVDGMCRDQSSGRLWSNKRSSVVAVEFRYVCNFLGVNIGGCSRLVRACVAMLLCPCIAVRVVRYLLDVRRIRSARTFE